MAAQKNGDKIEISMYSNERGMFNSLIIRDKSGRNETDLSNKIEFIFEDPVYYKDPLPRIPPHAMVWVTDTRRQIHDEWKKEKDGAAANA